MSLQAILTLATNNEEIVNSMRRRVVELHTGKIVRDERKGGYDSSVYFPDRETEAQASSGQGSQAEDDRQNSESRDDKPAGSTDRAADKRYREGSVPAGDEAEDDGLKRLANSVHSGRTGRYAATFQSAEDTLTWGKGLLPENSGSPDQPDDPGYDTHEEGGN